MSVTTVAVLFVVLRLMAVTHYQWDQAFAVVDAINLDDAVSVVLGTFMADEAISAAALLVLSPVMLLHAARRRREGDSVVGSVAVLAALVVLLVGHVRSFGSWWLAVGIAVLTVLLALLLTRRAGREAHRSAEWLVHRTWLVLGVALLAVAATVTTPWVPREQLETANGTVVHGYVLGTPPGYLQVLLAGSRELVIIPTAEVVSRTER